MSFKFQVNQNPLTIEFEAGSVKEGLAILQDSSNELGEFFQIAAGLMNSTAAAPAVPSTPAPPTVPAAPEATTDKPKRGRPAKAAEAPPPVPVPGAAPPAPPAPPAIPAAPVAAPPAPPAAPVDHTPNASGTPAFLDRTKPVAPPPVPPAPPAPTPVAPKFDLGRKIAESLKLRCADDATKAQFAEWLKGCGVGTGDASFDDRLSVLEFTADDKAKPIADLLGIS